MLQPRNGWNVVVVQLAVLIAALQPHRVLGKDLAMRFLPEHFYNPSLVGYGSLVFCAIKHTDFRTVQSKVWWLNRIQMCRGQLGALEAMQCTEYQPWGSKLNECELGPNIRGGKVDSLGLGDTKLWAWPGKGVYAIFGHKPQRQTSTQLSNSSRAHAVREDSRFCQSQLVYHQWLVQVWADPEQPRDDDWRLVGQEPLPLLPDPNLHQYPEDLPYVMEKNWMPWVYRDPDTQAERLMVTYMVMPHTVWEVLPSGTSVPRYRTSSDTLFAKFAKFSVHGGPPVVWVPPALAQGQQGYYLGIMHHFERWRRGKRLYRHFAFKFSAQPPFQVTAISDELPLETNILHKGRLSRIAFVNGLYLEPYTGTLYVTYGTADAYSRLWTLTVQELDKYFSGRITFRDHDALEDQADVATQAVTYSQQQSTSSRSSSTMSFTTAIPNHKRTMVEKPSRSGKAKKGKRGKD